MALQLKSVHHFPPEKEQDKISSSVFLMDDGANPPEEVITHRWGLFCLKIPTKNLVGHLLDLYRVCNAVECLCWDCQ